MSWLRSIANLFTMRERDRAKWERVRAKGKRRFVIMRGVLGVGLGAGILSSVLSELEGVQSFHLWPGLLINVVVFAVGGLFWGIWVWDILEGQYQSGIRS